MVRYEGGVTIVFVPESLKRVVESAEPRSGLARLADEDEASRGAPAAVAQAACGVDRLELVLCYCVLCSELCAPFVEGSDFVLPGWRARPLNVAQTVAFGDQLVERAPDRIAVDSDIDAKLLCVADAERALKGIERFGWRHFAAMRFGTSLALDEVNPVLDAAAGRARRTPPLDTACRSRGPARGRPSALGPCGWWWRRRGGRGRPRGIRRAASAWNRRQYSRASSERRRRPAAPSRRCRCGHRADGCCAAS